MKSVFGPAAAASPATLGCVGETLQPGPEHGGGQRVQCPAPCPVLLLAARGWTL